MTRRLITLTFAVFMLYAPNKLSATEPTASILVDSFHSTLLQVMKDADALGFKGRYDALEPVVSKSFHFPLMMQIATGRYWKQSSKQQQQSMSTAFARISIGTYAARFDGYSGQSFMTINEKPGPQKTVLVKTELMNPGGDDVNLTYVTRKIKGNWRIIDVLLGGGISEIAVRRSEYRNILKAGGPDQLISILEDKAGKLGG